MARGNAHQQAPVTRSLQRKQPSAALENKNPGDDSGTVDETIEMLDAELRDLPEDFEGLEADVGEAGGRWGAGEEGGGQ